MNFNSNPEDRQEHNKFLYIWIDILGFREDLNNPEIYDKLFNIREEFKNSFSQNEIRPEAVITISDGLVLVWKLSILNQNNIKQIFNSLGKLQMNFILEQRKVLRGAISVGDVSINLYNKYRNENSKKEEFKDIFLISNGLVKAYIMESKDIKWPIIATTYEVLEEIRNILNINNETEQFGLKKINGTNHVYLYMIDFLSNIDNNETVYEDFLLKQLNEYSRKDKKIFEKYYWLLKYSEKRYDINQKKFNEFNNGVLI